MELLCILIRFMIKIDVNLSILLVFKAIYPIVLLINITIINTTGETIVKIIFARVSVCSKIQTKDNNTDNSPLVITVNNNFKCLDANLTPVESSSCSTSKKLIDISQVLMIIHNLFLNFGLCFRYPRYYRYV